MKFRKVNAAICQIIVDVLCLAISVNISTVILSTDNCFIVADAKDVKTSFWIDGRNVGDIARLKVINSGKFRTTFGIFLPTSPIKEGLSILCKGTTITPRRLVIRKNDRLVRLIP